MEEVLADTDSPEQAEQEGEGEARDDTENAAQRKTDEEAPSMQWSEGRKVRRKRRAESWAGFIYSR